MWIFVRVCILLGSLAYRWIFRSWGILRESGRFEGKPYYLRKKSHKGSPRGYDLGFPLPAELSFRFHRETGWDRLMKSLHLVREFQTQDAEFDRLVYITSDHWGLNRVLAEDAELRGLVRTLFDDSEVRGIYGDGNALWLERRAMVMEPKPGDLSRLSSLLGRLEEPLSTLGSAWADPFFWKALVIEGLTLGLVGYGVAGFLENVLNPQDYHVYHRTLWFTSLWVAGGLVGAFCLLFFGWLRGSSRTHRLALSCGILLIPTSPLIGFQLTSDLNRGLDRSIVWPLERTVMNKEMKVSRGRRGRTTYTCYAVFDLAIYDPQSRIAEADSRTYPLPSRIRVSRSLYDQLVVGRKVEFQISPGWLGFPWYRSIRPL